MPAWLTTLVAEKAASAKVDDLKDVLSRREGGADKHDEAHHGHAAVVHLRRRGQAGLALERGQETVRLLIRLTVEQRQRIAEHLGAEGSRHRHAKRVDVRHHDDGALIGDVLAEANLREATPVLVLQRNIRVRKPPVTLGVRRHDDREPAEHGVAAVPPLGLGRRAEAILGD